MTANDSGTGSVFSDTVTVTGNGTYKTGSGTTTGSDVPTATGTYTWVAVYSGDANNSAADDQGGTSEQETVTARPPRRSARRPARPSSPCGNGDVLTDTADARRRQRTRPARSPSRCTSHERHAWLDTETVTVKGNGYVQDAKWLLPAATCT